MALDEAPPFWWKKGSWQGWLLAPLGYLYGRAAAIRMESAPGHSVNVPVICVGNFVAGGAGKTPTVELFCRHLKAAGMKPGVLSRGHGGAVTVPTVVNLEHHNAHDVGDEALLHAQQAITVVSSDRPKGADLLIENKCNIIIMDDGFQNPSLQKDYSLVVVDSKRGLGNGFPIPAGPLRLPLKRQLLHADAVFIIGDYDEGYTVVRKVARSGKPVYRAEMVPVKSSEFKGKEVLGFAGIADPSKFFDTLEALGCSLKDRQGFGDHHFYTEEECVDLINRSRDQKLELVTTTKDWHRLKDMGTAQNDLAKFSKPLEIKLKPEDPGMLDVIVKKATDRLSQRRLKRK